MDLDEMREKWAEYDRKLETNLRTNRQILNAMHLNRARSALQRLVAGLFVEACLTFVVIVALGDFIYEHVTQARFVIPAVALDVYAIAFLNIMVRQIILALQID